MRLGRQSAPPIRLSPVKRLVGARQGLFEILFCRLHLREAHAERTGLKWRCASTTTTKKSFGNPTLAVATRREQQDELIAAYPRQRTGLRISDACGFARNTPQHRVSSFMAMNIVDGFEMVDIDRDYGCARRVEPLLLDFQSGPVPRPCQRVAQRHGPKVGLRLIDRHNEEAKVQNRQQCLIGEQWHDAQRLCARKNTHFPDQPDQECRNIGQHCGPCDLLPPQRTRYHHATADRHRSRQSENIADTRDQRCARQPTQIQHEEGHRVRRAH